MIVLGINGFSQSKDFFATNYNRTGIDRNRVLGHDAGAAIFIDGVLIAAVEEERLNREKKTSCFPIQSINYCLKKAAIKVEDIDCIAFPWDFNKEALIEIIQSTLQSNNSIDKIFNIIDQYKKLFINLVSHEQVISDFNNNIKTVFPENKFLFVPHHVAHLMCGYFTAQYKDSAFLISDGRAEQYSAIIGEITKDKITIFDEASVNLNNSIGMFYSKITRYLGFMPNNDEYKIMALSDFGDRNKYIDKQELIINYISNGRYTINIDNELYNNLSYNKYFDKIFSVEDQGKMSFQQKCDIAVFAQEIVEKTIKRQLEYLRTKSNFDHLIFEGGIALNCKNNGKLLIDSVFNDIHVSFGASDVGLCIGAAYYQYYINKKFNDNHIIPFLGPVITDENIEAELNKYKNQIVWEFYEKEDELLDDVTKLIYEGKIVAWCQNSIEFGPRALGNRSILANPAIPKMKDILNNKIKFREPFRPFAVSILNELTDKYFHMCGKKNSPFMTFTFKVKDGCRDNLISGLHIDDTSRVQTVDKSDNLRYWKLLNRFYNKYNIPGVINTSFNIQGQPIICNVSDSVECLLKTGLDVLVVENYIVNKLT